MRLYHTVIEIPSEEEIITFETRKQMRLTAEEIAFFKRYGYLIKKRVLDPVLIQKTQDRLWATAPPPCLNREDPGTWQGPIPQDQVSADPLNIKSGFLWQVRSIGTEKLVLDLIARNTAVSGMAAQLLGNDILETVEGGCPMGTKGPAWPGGPTDPALGPNEGIRGIYVTLPHPRGAERLPEGLHTDGHPMQLGVVGLLADCPPGGGAFQVWPGSHRRFYPTFLLQHDQLRIPYYEQFPTLHKSEHGGGRGGLYHTKEYLAELERVRQDTPPVDCHGEAGDIVFWHHRLGHAAGHNYLPGHLRVAVLHDFNTQRLDALRLLPPREDMWQDWSEEVRCSPDDLPIPQSLVEKQNLRNTPPNSEEEVGATSALLSTSAKL